MMRFQPKELALIVAGPLLVVAAYFTWGWAGVALAIGAGLMWALLHFTRILGALKRAAKRPKGWVSSAVMLHSRLHPGMKMLQVVQLTGALGDCVLELDPATLKETWRWTDEGGDFVEVVLVDGRVLEFFLRRAVAG